jgi:hypothetical protein
METVSPLPQSGPDNSETRLWNTLAHAICLTGLVTGLGFVLGPLIVWMIQRERFPSVDQHGKESINLNLSMLIYQVALVVGGFVVGVPTCGLGIWVAGVASLVLVAAHLVLVIVASAQAWSGGFYRYPFILRLIK